ncbi:hypothetical protein, partial [Streptomyces sp. NPDC002491]
MRSETGLPDPAWKVVRVLSVSGGFAGSGVLVVVRGTVQAQGGHSGGRRRGRGRLGGGLRGGSERGSFEGRGDGLAASAGRPGADRLPVVERALGHLVR